nr:HigA family addiction module antitoxin [Pseudomonas luteola]
MDLYGYVQKRNAPDSSRRDSESVASFAQTASIPEITLNNILGEHQEITSDLALLLSNALGTTAKFWMSLQSAYDLRLAELAKNGNS